MGCSTSVYLQIRDWNYWWNVYQFGGAEPSVPQGAEFSLKIGRASCRERV